MLHVLVTLFVLALTAGVVLVGIFLLAVIVKTVFGIFRGGKIEPFSTPWIKDYRWRNR
jgi:hypothetical protein